MSAICNGQSVTCELRKANGHYDIWFDMHLFVKTFLIFHRTSNIVYFFSLFDIARYFPKTSASFSIISTKFPPESAGARDVSIDSITV